MATKGVIAEGAVKIALTGYEQAKQQLQQLGQNAKTLGSNLASVGRAASVGFAAASATMLSLVRAADPVRFTIFEQQLKITAVLIGRLFIPILKQLIQIVNRVNIALAGMTREQMDGASKWGKIGLIVLGVGTALAFVAKVVSTVAGAFGTLWGIVAPLISGLGSVLRMLGKFLPIGRIIKLVSLAFLALNGEGGRLGEMFGRLKAMALPVLEKLWDITKQLWEGFKMFAGMVGDLSDAIFDKAGGGLLDVFEELLPLLEKGMNIIKDILGGIASAVKMVTDTIKDAKAIYTVLAEKKLSEIPGAVAQGVGRSLTDAGTSLAKSATLGMFDETIGGIGDFFKDDVIGGKEDETKMTAERKKLDEPAEGADYGGGGGDYGDDNADPYKPLMPTGKVQTMGVEDAFKRAQEGAGFDPAKATEMVIKLLASQGKISEEMLKAMVAKSGAYGAY